MSRRHFLEMLRAMRALQHVDCDSAVVAGAAVASLVHAMRESEALLGRQVNAAARLCGEILSAGACSSCRCP